MLYTHRGQQFFLCLRTKQLLTIKESTDIMSVNPVNTFEF